MSDIVERLRVTGEYGGPALCTEAADEIDRLRALAAVEDGADTNWRHEAERLREQVKYWNGIACEDRAEVERLRECLQGIIAYAPEHEPREPDDADWRFKFLEARRAAQTAISSLRKKP